MYWFLYNRHLRHESVNSDKNFEDIFLITWGNGNSQTRKKLKSTFRCFGFHLLNLFNATGFFIYPLKTLVFCFLIFLESDKWHVMG